MTFGAWEWLHVAIGGCASVIFLFQTFADADDEAIGAHGDDISLSGYLSVRNFVAFFIGYGWVTLACLSSDLSRAASSSYGVAAGVSFAAVSVFLIKMFMGFQEDGSIELETLAGEPASVYIAIGASMSSQGKVMVDTRKGRMELPARTRDPEPLRPGRMVRIQNAEGGVLWVTKDGE